MPIYLLGVLAGALSGESFGALILVVIGRLVVIGHSIRLEFSRNKLGSCRVTQPPIMPLFVDAVRLDQCYGRGHNLNERPAKLS